MIKPGNEDLLYSTALTKLRTVLLIAGFSLLTIGYFVNHSSFRASASESTADQIEFLLKEHHVEPPPFVISREYQLFWKELPIFRRSQNQSKWQNHSASESVCDGKTALRFLELISIKNCHFGYRLTAH